MIKPRSYLTQAQQVFRIAFSYFGWKFWLMVFMGFLSSFSAAIGISIIIPLFSLLTDGGQGTNTITETIRQGLGFLHIPFTLNSLLILMAGLFIIKAVVLFIAKYLNERLAANYELRIRTNLFRGTMDTVWPFLMEQKLGYLERVIMKDVSVSAGLIIQISNLIIFSTSFITYAGVALTISPIIMAISALFGIVLFAVFHPLARRIRTSSLRMRDIEKTIAHSVNERIIGAKIIKASGSERVVSTATTAHFIELRLAELKSAFYRTLVGSLFEPISFVFLAALVLFYSQRPAFDIASLAAIVYFIQKMFSFVQTGQNTAQGIVTNIPYIQSVTEYSALVHQYREEKPGVPFSFGRELSFDHVGFSYDQKPVLRDVTFTIQRGSSIGVIGSSGSGKTTIVDLLLRLFEPTSGMIMVDGKPINAVDIHDWRNHIGYMAQEVFLLNDTIEQNIRFYNANLSEADIIGSAKAANIYQFITSLPHGFQTVIGERGIKVSGGERQRIALARILARKPEILILDEATSALDSQSESMIQETIENLRGHVTVIVIAHRLSTIMRSDKILVLGDGKILEEGIPQELLQDKDSHFYEMYYLTGHDKNNA